MLGKSNYLLTKYFKYIKSSEVGSLSATSNLWANYLSRRDKYSISDDIEEVERGLSNFLSPFSNQALGTGKPPKVITNDGEHLYKYFLDHLNQEVFDRTTASKCGSPEMFNFNGKLVNMTFLWNLLGTSEYFSKINLHGFQNSNLNIIEVGPGYGAACLQWIQLGVVDTYTLVDLRENLINSVYFLSQNLPDWNFKFVGLDECSALELKTIYFVIPEYIEHIPESVHFDMGLNTDSLGEMPLSVATSYIDFFHRKIRENGTFISSNGHRRGQLNSVGAQSVSEYRYNSFKLIDLGPRLFCSSAFDDFSHTAIMVKSSFSHNEINLDAIDTVCNLYAAGLNLDIIDVSNNIVNCTISTADYEFLISAKNILESDSKSLVATNDYRLNYLIVIKQVANGYKPDLSLLRSQLHLIKSDIARLYLYSIGIYLRDSDLLACSERDESSCVQLYIVDFISYSSRNYLLREILFRIRFDTFRKKLSPFNFYNPSILIKTKNLFLNFIQNRNFSIYRA